MSGCWSGHEQDCSSQVRNHRRGALKWQVLFRTAGYQVSPSRHACKPHPSPGVSSFWRCLSYLVTVQGRRRQFRYLYALRDAEVTVESQESPSRAADLPRARGSGPRARPLAPAQCSTEQHSAVPSHPGRSSRGLPAPGPTHRSLGSGPRTGHWRAAGLAGDSGAHGAHAAGAVYTRDPVPPPGAAGVVPPAEQRRQAPPPLPTDSFCGHALSWRGRLFPRSPRPQSEWTVSVASPGRHNSGGPRTCPLPSLWLPRPDP